MPVDPMYQQLRMRIACEGCGKPHENASEEIICMRSQLAAVRHALTAPKPAITAQVVDQRAAKAYAEFAREVWGSGPAHVQDLKSVHPPPAHAVSWEQLPYYAKETWRRVARAALEG